MRNITLLDIRETRKNMRNIPLFDTLVGISIEADFDIKRSVKLQMLIFK